MNDNGRAIVVGFDGSDHSPPSRTAGRPSSTPVSPPWPLTTGETPYDRTGDWLPALAVAALLTGAVAAALRAGRRSPSALSD